MMKMLMGVILRKTSSMVTSMKMLMTKSGRMTVMTVLGAGVMMKLMMRFHP